MSDNAEGSDDLEAEVTAMLRRRANDVDNVAATRLGPTPAIDTQAVTRPRQRLFAGTAAACVLAIFGLLAVLSLGSDNDITNVVSQPAATFEATPTPGNAEAAGSTAELGAPTRLLPDPERWVVVDDWNARNPDRTERDDLDGLQLDVAPLDEDGVPQLGRRISLSYGVGTVEDFDRRWGDAESVGDSVNFDLENGIGRSVRNAVVGYATAQVWVRGTFVSIQTQDPDTDLTELAKSLTEVDETTWNAARAGVDEQRLIAVEAAMQTVEAVPGPGEPLPHWVLPEPWQLLWVTDKTIWTPEQRAQAAGFAEAMRSPATTQVTASDFQSWQFGFADTVDDAVRQFVPQVTISALVFAEAPAVSHPTNYEPISALGLEGVLSPFPGSSTMVELGTGEVRVNVQTFGLDEQALREFLDAIEFASDDPLDGFIASDQRFQPLALEEWDERPVSWHAKWQNPDGGPDATVSVWRLSVPELRIWMQGRGGGLQIPDDVWETIAAAGVIDFGFDATYDVSTGLLRTMHGVEPSKLVSIALADWIALVGPVNTDPLNPR